MGTLLEDQYTFLIISPTVFIRMRNVSDKNVDKIKTRILCSITLFFLTQAIYEIMWNNSVEPDT